VTNRELLIASLKDELDDWAASEANIAYNIACPYFAREEHGHPCDREKYPWDTLRVCGPCKMEWLDKEVSP
jgi:hypothetical protein